MLRPHADVQDKESHEDFRPEHPRVHPVMIDWNCATSRHAGNAASVTVPQATASVKAHTRAARNAVARMQKTANPARIGATIKARTICCRFHGAFTAKAYDLAGLAIND